MKPIKKHKKRRKTSSIKSLSWWKKDTQKKFNALITSKAICERHGYLTGGLQCSHVFPVGTYGNLRYDIINALSLCGGCHRFFWHDNPGDAWEWFREKYPDRYKYLIVAKNKYKKWTIPDLQQIQEYIENRDYKKLVTFPT